MIVGFLLDEPVEEHIDKKWLMKEGFTNIVGSDYHDIYSYTERSKTITEREIEILKEFEDRYNLPEYFSGKLETVNIYN